MACLTLALRFIRRWTVEMKSHSEISICCLFCGTVTLLDPTATLHERGGYSKLLYHKCVNTKTRRTDVRNKSRAVPHLHFCCTRYCAPNYYIHIGLLRQAINSGVRPIVYEHIPRTPTHKYFRVHLRRRTQIHIAEAQITWCGWKGGGWFVRKCWRLGSSMMYDPTFR